MIKNAACTMNISDYRGVSLNMPTHLRIFDLV